MGMLSGILTSVFCCRAGQDKKSKKDKTSAKHSLNKALQAHLAWQEDSDDDDAHVA